jgi:hypothetical protein
VSSLVLFCSAFKKLANYPPLKKEIRECRLWSNLLKILIVSQAVTL